jgi:hypothetical protein
MIRPHASHVWDWFFAAAPKKPRSISKSPVLASTACCWSFSSADRSALRWVSRAPSSLMADLVKIHDKLAHLDLPEPRILEHLPETHLLEL